MRDHLPGISAGVDDQAVTFPGDALLFSDLPGSGEQAPDQRFISRRDLIHGGDMPVWHDQDVFRRGRVDVVEGGHLFIAKDHLRL